MDVTGQTSSTAVETPVNAAEQQAEPVAEPTAVETPEQQPETVTEPETEQREVDPLKELSELEMDDEAQAKALMDIMGQSDQSEKPEESEQPKSTAEVKPTAETGFYSPEELNATPLDAIDEARLPESAREYLPIVRQNMAIARQTIAALQQQNAMLVQQLQGASSMQTTPQAQSAAPAKPDFKTLASQAAKLAKERLGLAEDDDLDMTYDPEHAAAFHMAMREIADGQRNAAAQQQQEAAAAQTARNEWDMYVTQFAARPDFHARDKWITERITKAGKNPNMLADYIRQTGDFAGARRVLDAWNRMYDTEQARVQQAVKNQARPGQKPPVLESASGVDASGRRSMSLKAFGAMEMDPEAQAKALVNLGIV